MFKWPESGGLGPAFSGLGLWLLVSGTPPSLYIKAEAVRRLAAVKNSANNVLNGTKVLEINRCRDKVLA
ncbi:MAG: hypothetical protein ACYC6Z_08660 [Thermoleophilia bacterium]